VRFKDEARQNFRSSSIDFGRMICIFRILLRERTHFWGYEPGKTSKSVHGALLTNNAKKFFFGDPRRHKGRKALL